MTYFNRSLKEKIETPPEITEKIREILKENNKIIPRSCYKRIKFNGKSISEHRFIWEINNGKIKEGYVIHHINKNKLDNNLSNLKCLSVMEHGKFHRRDNKK